MNCTRVHKGHSRKVFGSDMSENSVKKLIASKDDCTVLLRIH